jgi:type IX secretion system PorP/SprF family membrane protein
MRKIISLGLFLVFAMTAIAQQDAMFTHYMFNTLDINPAYAGSRNAMSIVGIHRSQWTGFDGAPVTQSISMNTPLFREEFAGGFSVMNDKIGPIKTSSINLDFAYRMKINETSKLAFGVNGGINMFQGSFSDVVINNTNDESFQNNAKGRVLPNFGFGMYYSNQKFYAGLSTPKLVQNNYYSRSATDYKIFSSQRHYYFIAGALLNLSPTVKFRPSMLVKATPGAPMELDLTSSFVIKDLIWAGAMYRTGDAVGLLAGVNINKQMQLSYAFDWSFGINLGQNRSGSHEIMLRYEMVYKDEEKIRSPRYF